MSSEMASVSMPSLTYLASAGLLFVALAPLESFYALLFSCPANEELEKTKIAVNELWMEVLATKTGPFRVGVRETTHHLQMVLLWCIILLLGLSSLCFSRKPPKSGLQRCLEVAVEKCLVSESESCCGICLDKNSNMLVRGYSCSHVFHKTCMIAWLAKSPHCPVCRQDFLNPKNTRKLEKRRNRSHT